MVFSSVLNYLCANMCHYSHSIFSSQMSFIKERYLAKGTCNFSEIAVLAVGRSRSIFCLIFCYSCGGERSLA